MNASFLTRSAPGLISGTAVPHILAGLAPPNPVGVMADDGLVGSVGGDPGRDFSLWYMMAGSGLLARAAST